MQATGGGNAGTPWLLLAIYVALAGQAIATSDSPLDELAGVVSLLPALVGTYFVLLQHAGVPEE